MRMICEVIPAQRAAIGIFAKGVREVQHHGGAIEQRNVGDGCAEQIAYLVADQLDQAILIELCGQRLGDAVDGDQLSRALANRVLLFD